MNDERWILAQLKRRLITIGKEHQKKGYEYFPTWADEVFELIAEIEAEAVLGAPTEEEIEEVL